jgi:hypothetical protein
MKKHQKEHTKNEYAKLYDRMIEDRREKEKAEKERELWLERNLLHQNSWLKDPYQQKEIEKQRKYVRVYAGRSTAKKLKGISSFKKSRGWRKLKG